jgi:(2R)-3-sulfolactate dehydrogenase (NADP+)
LGQTLIAIQPDGLGQTGHAQRLEDMLVDMTQEPNTRAPGDKRHTARAHADAHGVEVDDVLAGQLRELGALV